MHLYTIPKRVSYLIFQGLQWRLHWSFSLSDLHINPNLKTHSPLKNSFGPLINADDVGLLRSTLFHSGHTKYWLIADAMERCIQSTFARDKRIFEDSNPWLWVLSIDIVPPRPRFQKHNNIRHSAGFLSPQPETVKKIPGLAPAIIT